MSLVCDDESGLPFNSISRLQLDFWSLSPSLHLTSIPQCTDLTVQHVVWRELFSHPVTLQYPPPKSYQRALLKPYLSHLEAQRVEVLESLYTHHLQLLDCTSAACSASAPSLALAYQTFLLDRRLFHFRIQPDVFSDLGLVPWHASLAFSRRFQEDSSFSCIFRGRSVLELGAGVGLCALTLHRCGNAPVLATDGHPDVVENLSHNFKVNSPQLNGSLYLKASALRWEDASGLRFMLERERFVPQVVLGVDVMYDPQTAPVMVTLLHQMPESVRKAVFVCTVRQEQTVHLFLQALEQGSCCWESLQVEEQRDSDSQRFLYIHCTFK